MDEVIIYPSKLKMFLLAAGSLLFVAIGIFLFTVPDSQSVPRWAILIAFYVGTPFFALSFVYSVYRLLSPKPSLIINREGLFDNASAVGAGLLKWEEIAEIFPYDFLGNRMLGIVPLDAETIIARQPFIKRILARINRGLV